MFHALGAAGVRIDHRPLEPSPTTGDLAALRAKEFTPAGDGRVCLLRRHGPLDTADEIAAALAARDDLDGVVLIGADSILDRALSRHGLPRVGAWAGAPASSRLLELVLEAAFRPMESSDLHALLTADPGPIPQRVAGPLLKTLQRFPGRGNHGMARGTGGGALLAGRRSRKKLEERIRLLLEPDVARGRSLCPSRH